ncbi:MAG TPA: ABC transporter permease [Candidatus Sulfotelmatobacter sp.]|jgi:ABC-2 type transport system permease protein|nr:ABC transporter permease [Candidatus Sulfotelmatobacter sp.]
MSTATIALSNPRIERSPRHTATIYMKEIQYEFLKNLRLRMYTASVLSFPLMFYVLFGLVLNSHQMIGGTSVPTYLIGTYGPFGVMGASLFGTAAGLASDRGLGWLQVKRASPMPPFAYFAAKIVTSMIFSTFIVLALFALGYFFGGVRLSIPVAARALGTLTIGSLPFSAMGLALGYFTGPNSAPATINLIYLPMSFCSGLWVPFMFLPKVVQHIALVLPPYHLSQLALGVVGAGSHESAATHWEVLAAFTMICLGVARIGFQRDQGKLYG